MFLGPDTSQENLKRPETAPKKNTKSSKTPQKKIENGIQYLTNFG